jgi:hypothetical protein
MEKFMVKIEKNPHSNIVKKKILFHTITNKSLC